MAALTGLFVVAGQAMGGQRGMMVAFFSAVAMIFFAYWFIDKMALAMSRAQEVSLSEAPELHAIVGGLA